MENKVVVIKSIAKPNWSNIKKYPNTKDVLTCPLDAATGSYKTGLTPEKRSELEQKLKVDLSPSRTNEFWQNFSIVFKDNDDKTLNLEDPIQELEYYVLLEHRLVAKDMGELKQRPHVKYVFYDQDKEYREMNLKAKVEREAISTFNSLTPEEIREYLIMIGRSAGNVSAHVAETTFYEWVKENPQQFLDMHKDPKKEVKALISKLHIHNIIRKSGRAYYYNDDLLGLDFDETIAFFENKKNGELRKLLQERLTVK